MSLLASIAGWFMGGSKTADTVINDVSSGLDKIVYTDQEKAEASQKGFELFIEYQKATLPQNVARRQLALIVLVLWVLLILTECVGIISGFAWKKELQDLIGTITPYVGGVWAFYFVKRFIPDSKPTDSSK